MREHLPAYVWDDDYQDPLRPAVWPPPTAHAARRWFDRHQGRMVEETKALADMTVEELRRLPPGGEYFERSRKLEIDRKSRRPPRWAALVFEVKDGWQPCG